MAPFLLPKAQPSLASCCYGTLASYACSHITVQAAEHTSAPFIIFAQCTQLNFMDDLL